MASLYIHIPFCQHKCIYCDFYSLESMNSMDVFTIALKREIGMYSGYSGKERFETIYFGGGTPSLLSAEAINEVLELLNKTFCIDEDAEITVEANPGTVDKVKLKKYREAGVNRMSFGVQSFHDDDLRFLTRIHTPCQAYESVRFAKEIGYENISIDLIFALPNQTLRRWEENLRQAVELQPQHISAYGLIVEQDTPLARMIDAGQVSPLPLEAEAEMYELTMQYLSDAGYEHYEVSNYALPGFRSHHNSNYWNHSNYLGFGPSAHSFWSNRRWWNASDVQSYCKKIFTEQLPLAGEEFLTTKQLFDEDVMLGLRSGGINLHHLESNYDIDLLRARHSIIEQLVADDLLIPGDRVLRLTDKGFLLCDEISNMFLSPVTKG